MTDKIKDNSYEAAIDANKDLGGDHNARQLLSDANLGAKILTKYEEAVENTRDHLTGAYSRRFVEQEIETLLSKKKPFALVVYDLDDLKVLNDTYGHEVGDVALKHLVTVGNSVIKVTRVQGVEDVLGRYGGDEFLIILRGVTDSAVALQVTERLKFKVGSSEFSTEEGKKLKASVSYGVTLAKEGDSLLTIEKRADTALYQAKRQGKDRIVLI